MTANSRHRLAGRTEEGELKDMTDATDKKIENIIDATATATDETKEAAKHVVDGAATVGKNVAGVVKKFVTTLVSKGGKDDTDGVKTDEAKGE